MPTLKSARVIYILELVPWDSNNNNMNLETIKPEFDKAKLNINDKEKKTESISLKSGSPYQFFHEIKTYKQSI